MGIMISEVYNGFRSIGFGEKESRDAAEAVSSFLPEMFDLKSKMSLLQWMQGAIWAFSFAMFWKVFS
jgi:methionine salvage enolase-phosphatase E1